ncbi:hypothetical protein UA32_12610 [Photobacterium angustum]|uniref:Uncharacterized protein n=1 Tax=Photobacterium angustum TaxID=661 RepID=A0ABX5H143_PHOAN|nr:hypothetical protein [Photobacterium angustum]KJG37787.1 hypothetical protein UA32_12610 [Photobacterium angustum]PSX07057.1 hypothetical protein C0W27_15930 [Photobacterium angustum]
MFRMIELDVRDHESFHNLPPSDSSNRLNQQIQYLLKIKMDALNNSIEKIRDIAYSSPVFLLLLISINCITIDTIVRLFTSATSLLEIEIRNIRRAFNHYTHVIERLTTSRQLMHQHYQPIAEFRRKYTSLSCHDDPAAINKFEVKKHIQDARDALFNSDSFNLLKLIRIEPLLFVSSCNENVA